MSNTAFQGKVIGIIAGSGELPCETIEHCLANGRDVFVVGFEGHTDQLPLDKIPHKIVHLGAVGGAIKALKKSGAETVTFVGRITRPTFSALKMDLTTLKLIKRITKARFIGDNFLFKTIISFIEEYGFKVVGVQDIAPELVTAKGVLGKHKPNKRMKDDIEIATHILRTMGELDVGQGAIVKSGFVLGIEAIEGTDALIKRCGELRKKEDGGVLVKLKKPSQEDRIDLPTIGVDTVRNIHAAGLKGIAVEAGASLIVQRDAMIKEANKLGIVVVGV